SPPLSYTTLFRSRPAARSADLDQDHADRDDRDPGHHARRQRGLPDRPREKRHQPDPHGHPDPVRPPARHPRRQRGRQQRARDQVAHRDPRAPHLLPDPDRGAQAQGGDELGRDRREQPDPAHAETTSSSSTGRDPVSTRTTPTMINPIPAMAAPLRNSSNRTAPSTAVSETPAAP